jgi:anti-sigma factor RsiW
MTCDEHRGKMISRYLDGELSPAEERELRRHVEACASCAAFLEELRGTDELIKQALRDRWGGESVVEAVFAGSGKKAERSVRFRERRRVSILSLHPALAAALILMATTVILLIHSSRLSRENAVLRGEVARWRERSGSYQRALQMLLQNALTLRRGSERKAEEAAAAQLKQEGEQPSGAPLELASGEGNSSSSTPYQPNRAPQLKYFCLRALPQSDGVCLLWDEIAGCAYDIYRRCGAGGEYEGPLNREPLRDTFFVDTSVSPLGTYWYKVVASKEEPEAVKVESTPVAVTAPPDIEIIYKGTSRIGEKRCAHIEVVKRPIGAPEKRQVFHVEEGMEIGKRIVDQVTGRPLADMRTGYRLVSINARQVEHRYVTRKVKIDPQTKKPVVDAQGKLQYEEQVLTLPVEASFIVVEDETGRRVELHKTGDKPNQTHGTYGRFE